MWLLIILNIWFSCISNNCQGYYKPCRLKRSDVASLQLAKNKPPQEVFFCQECGIEHIRWVGKCNSCGTWNSVKQFKESRLLPIARTRSVETTSSSTNSVSPWLNTDGRNIGLIKMDTIKIDGASHRLILFSSELNRVLGGGIVSGSVVLIAGEPGIGKSTLLIQLAASASKTASPELSRSVVYISGEENPEQLASRAIRLGLDVSNVFLICDIDTDNVGTLFDRNLHWSKVS